MSRFASRMPCCAAVLSVPLLALAQAAAAEPTSPMWHAIPQGTFTFGCADETPNPAEKKPEPTTVRPFWLSGSGMPDYQACVDAAPETCRPLALGATTVPYLSAVRFCRWLGGRLPTEIEWEYVADREATKNPGDRIVDADGGKEWVIGPRDLWSQQENYRGGVPDLEPIRRCDRSFANGDVEKGEIGFRCVRESPPPVLGDITGNTRSYVKRTFRGFEMRGTSVRLHTRLSDADAAVTFVGCKDALVPLGKWISSTTTKVEGYEEVYAEPLFEEVHLYASPCSQPSFVLTAPDARAGTFVPLGMGPTFESEFFGRVTFTPASIVQGETRTKCAIESGSDRIALPGDYSACAIRLAADLNGDQVPDFVVEGQDMCTSQVLVLSNAASWHVANVNDVWCPD